MSVVRAIGRLRNLKVYPIKPCSRWGPASSLSFRHISLYFDAALQTRIILTGWCGFSTGWCGKYNSFPKVPFTSDPFNIFTNPFLHLYLLTVDTKFSGLRPFGIFAPVSKADPKLRCSWSVGWTLVHSSPFPLRTTHLWTSSNSLASSVPAFLPLTDWRRWFWRHRLGYSQAILGPLWRRKDKDFV